MSAEFSETHRAAFRQYQAKGYAVDGLSDAQLVALEEDPNFRKEIAILRRKREEAAATKAARVKPAASPEVIEANTKQVATAVANVLDRGDTRELDACFREFHGTDLALALHGVALKEIYKLRNTLDNIDAHRKALLEVVVAERRKFNDLERTVSKLHGDVERLELAHKQADMRAHGYEVPNDL